MGEEAQREEENAIHEADMRGKKEEKVNQDIELVAEEKVNKEVTVSEDEEVSQE